MLCIVKCLKKTEVGIPYEKQSIFTTMSSTKLKQQENTWIYIVTGVIHP